MFTVAIIDDDDSDRASIAAALERFSRENDAQFDIETFSDPVSFIDGYSPKYDLVFIDIQMPHMDGMEAAARLRRVDDRVIVVFITNVAGMAVKGYTVDALDYIVKPVRYGGFDAMMKKALKRLRAGDGNIVVKTPDGLVRLRLNDVLYVEVRDHRVFYHTAEGELETWSSLKAEREKLPEPSFAACSNYAIVNLRYVKGIIGSEVRVGDEVVPVSRSRKKELCDRLMSYYGGLV